MTPLYTRGWPLLRRHRLFLHCAVTRAAFTLVSVQEHAGGNWKTYAMSVPPYVVMTDSSGESSVMSWPQNYSAGGTTQIDLQPSNVTVT
jgi:type IV secretory pathway TrbF-like protein